MNISLSESIDAKVGSRGFATSSEYVRELIRKDLERQQLSGLVLAGAHSSPTAPVDVAYFDGLRKRIIGKKSK